jgi:hypothetical protein
MSEAEAAIAEHETKSRLAAKPKRENGNGTTSLLQDILNRVDAIGVAQSRPSPVRLRSWEEIERFAEKAAKSGMVPKDYIGKADAICIAVQMGSELGLAPMQALQNIAVINGRPSIWGDAIPGLCRASGKCRSIREWHEGEGETLTYFCEAIRTDDPRPVIGRFSVEDAKRANLWKTEAKIQKMGRDGPYEVDAGPWYSYPQRMLQQRARGFALRDAFPDVLKGLMPAEEAQDSIPFEATGLSMPPVGTAAPILPKPEVKKEEKKDGPERSKEQWERWLVKLEAACRLATLEELEEISRKQEGTIALGPEWVEDEAAKIYATHKARLAPPPESKAIGDGPIDDDDGELDAEWSMEPPDDEPAKGETEHV